jgi:hypothetical protein
MRMKLDLSRVVWTAVVSALSGFGAITSALLGASDLTLALGLTSVASALLASRER